MDGSNRKVCYAIKGHSDDRIVKFYGMQMPHWVYFKLSDGDVQKVDYWPVSRREKVSKVIVLDVDAIELHVSGRLPAGWVVFYDHNKFKHSRLYYEVGDAYYDLNVWENVERYGSVKGKVLHSRTEVMILGGGFVLGTVLVEVGQTLEGVVSRLPIDISDDVYISMRAYQVVTEQYQVLVAGGEVVCIDEMYRSIDAIPSWMMGVGSDHVAPYDKITLLSYVNDCISRYEPASVYVMDIVVVNGVYKLREYKCFNAVQFREDKRVAVYSYVADYVEASLC